MINYSKKLITSFSHAIKQRIQENRRITVKDISILLRQLATLIGAGIPIITCLQIVEKSQIKLKLRQLLFTIKRDICSGKNLSSCMHLHPQHFDNITCQLIRIGEHTGKLDSLLLTLANEKEKQEQLRKNIQQALLYPCIITTIALLVTISMFIFVIPRFAELFANANIKLPLLTHLLFSLAALFQAYSYLILLPMLGLITLGLPYPVCQRLKHKCKLFLAQLPILKKYLHTFLLTQFSRNLAITLAAGIPINEALKLLNHLSTNTEFNRWVLTLRYNVNSGMQLHQAMTKDKYTPDIMIQMVKIGEESGMLDQMLVKLADFIEADIDHLITQLNQMLEPLIMLVLGALIGGLVIGMYLPVFKLGSTL